jgi:hypothetical protein
MKGLGLAKQSQAIRQNLANEGVSSKILKRFRADSSICVYERRATVIDLSNRCMDIRNNLLIKELFVFLNLPKKNKPRKKQVASSYFPIQNFEKI